MNEHSVSYPVMEYFYTIQGEGNYTGSPAFFLRLGGCDVGCVWCDVKESWDMNAHPKMSLEEILEAINSSGADLCVVTGGEPLMHDLTELTKALKSNNIRCHIETSGVYPITGSWDWITFSPKKFKAPTEEIYGLADELKIVVFNAHDITWAEQHAQKIDPKVLCYLQPEWEKRDSMIPIILNHVREFPKWRISLQTHKYIGVP